MSEEKINGTDEADKFFSDYVDSIIREMDLEKAPDEEKANLREKIAILVSKRITNALLMYLPEDKVKEASEKSDKLEPEEMISYLMGEIPEIETKLIKELSEIKNDIIQTNK